MVRVLDSGSSGPGSGPGWGHCVVFLGKKLGQDTLTVSLSTQVYKWVPANCWGSLHANEAGDKCRPHGPSGS